MADCEQHRQKSKGLSAHSGTLLHHMSYMLLSRACTQTLDASVQMPDKQHSMGSDKHHSMQFLKPYGQMLGCRAGANLLLSERLRQQSIRKNAADAFIILTAKLGSHNSSWPDALTMQATVQHDAGPVSCTLPKQPRLFGDQSKSRSCCN